ncbi:hypothetical protein NDU88_006976 [Pleurodeles waltl]|uniref:Uncharacterized protein n=1 Tax=Pleurodeles waltl TaxID=8319 RepID=A0AAV7RR08_PLEWA|nr:hypothetical protein NDU88_006976 [Pleurodeles waltl]
MKKLCSGRLLPGRSCLKTKFNPLRNKANPALLLKGQSQKQLFTFWGKENISIQEKKDEALPITTPASEPSGGPPREPPGELSGESYQAEVSQKRGVKTLGQGLLLSPAETAKTVRPAWSPTGPQHCPSPTSAWQVSSFPQADLAPKSPQESGAISSTASAAIGPCDFTLPDLNPDLLQRYGPQAKDLPSASVVSRSKCLLTSTGLELFNSTPSIQDSLYIHSHLSATPALEVSGIQPILLPKSEARLFASLFSLENLLASILKLLEKFVGGQDCILDPVTVILAELTKDKKVAEHLDPIQPNPPSLQFFKDQRPSWVPSVAPRRERTCEDICTQAGSAQCNCPSETKSLPGSPVDFIRFIFDPPMLKGNYSVQCNQPSLTVFPIFERVVNQKSYLGR